MLQNIREKSQGMLAWIIVILLIATFGLWGIHSYIASNQDVNSLAQVNGHSITQSEVNASYQRIRQQQQLQLGAAYQLNSGAEAFLKKRALNQIVFSIILTDQARKLGYRVTTAQVDQALLRLPAFQQDGQFSIERFHDVLSSMMYTQEQFLADMRSSMLINQAQGGIVNSEFVLPHEIERAIALVNQKRDISYWIIPTSRFAKNIVIQPKEIEQYYKSHQGDYQSPEQVSISYLTLSLKSIKNQLHFDKTKLQQYYETNIQNYTQPVQWHVAAIFLKVPEEVSHKDILKIQQRAQDIYDQIKAGKDFGQLAEQYSEDIPSAKHQGELDWFSAGSLDPIFEKTVANLQKPNDISLPVKTGYGFTIIKLLGEKKAKVLPFEEVEQQVENTLTQKQAEQIFSAQSDKLQSLVYANPNSLEVAAKTLNLDIQTTPLFSRKGTKSDITSYPKVVMAAFSNDVLRDGNNSDLIQVDPDTVIALRVKEHKPTAILPLADVENTIQIQLRNKQAQKDAESQGNKLISLLRQHQLSAAELTKKYNLILQQEKNAARFDTKIDAAILSTAFKMPHPDSKKDLPFSLKGVSLPSGDYAIVMLNTVHQGENSDSSIQERVFREEMESNSGNLEYQFYVKDIMKKAKIKFNQNAILQNSSDNNDSSSTPDSSS